MPPKALTPEVAQLAALFESVGISNTKSVDIARNTKVSPTLKSIVERGHLVDHPVNAKQGTLLIHLATGGGQLSPEAQSIAAEAIIDGRLQSADQVTGVPSQSFP